MSLDTEPDAPAEEAKPAKPSGLKKLEELLVVHPFLWGAFPILFLFAHNRREGIFVRDMYAPLEITLGAVAVLLLIGSLIFRNAQRVALVISVWVLLFFSYGHAADALDHTKLFGLPIGHAAYLLPLWGVLAAGAIVLGVLIGKQLPAITQALNLVAAGLVLINLIPIIMYKQPRPTAAAGGPSVSVPSPIAQKPKGKLPDIYYIVPEDYGNEQSQMVSFGQSSHDFMQFLRKKGFYVANDSNANYENTHQSLASSLNMQYLSTLLGKRDEEQDLVKEQLHDFEVARYLKSLGYSYVHMGSWWTPTASDPSADVNITYETWSEFSTLLYETTILPPVFGKLGYAKGQLDPRMTNYKRTLFQFDKLARIRDLPGPKFVFVHIMIPHPPYMFDKAGHYVSQAVARSRSRTQNFTEQLAFTDQKLEESIDHLLATRNKPVIILQTDEGLYPDARIEYHATEFDYRKVTTEQLKQKYRILNAYYLPGVEHPGLYPSITPVNTFRVVFNLYFKAGLPMLPDKSYARTFKPYKYIDITAVLKS